jgi:hypothetical protein
VELPQMKGIDPDSIPRNNTVAFRPGELQRIDNLAITGGA